MSRLPSQPPPGEREGEGATVTSIPREKGRGTGRGLPSQPLPRGRWGGDCHNHHPVGDGKGTVAAMTALKEVLVMRGQVLKVFLATEETLYERNF